MAQMLSRRQLGPQSRKGSKKEEARSAAPGRVERRETSRHIEIFYFFTYIIYYLYIT